MSKKYKDLTGQKFGRLLVIKMVERDKHHYVRWLCRCDCGNEKIALGNNLIRGLTLSCGCLRKEQCALNGRKNLVHGKHDTRIYRIWRNMKDRCSNPHNIGYKNYGGRGIKVCNEWKKFEPFYQWTINNGYADDLTLDRIDVNGNYCPENCRWATDIEQHNNTRANKFITAFGITLTLEQWSRKTNISPTTISRRIQRGWTTEEALTISPNKTNKINKIRKNNT